jgi:hypothetical protein
MLNSLFLVLFGRPLKHLSQRGNLKLLMDLIFKRRILNCIDELLRVLLHPPPPFGRESILREVRLTILKMIFLSMEK